jgi:hypothetical protein
MRLIDIHSNFAAERLLRAAGSQAVPTARNSDALRRSMSHACNSCWNDMRLRFDHKDSLWCTRHKGTPRRFECTRLITADHVKAVIKTIPGFGTHGKGSA